MGYKVKAEDWDIITPIAQRLSRITAGQSIVLKDEAQALDRLRHLLYAWMHETGLKPIYKVIRRSAEQLEVMRKYVPNPTIVVEDKVHDFVAAHLIELEDEDDVTRRIREAVLGNELTINEGTVALTEWQLAYGKAVDRTSLDRGGNSAQKIEL